MDGTCDAERYIACPSETEQLQMSRCLNAIL